MPNLTKDKIMDIAEQLVVQEHSTNIRIEKIAAELSVTHAAIYKHFKNRHDLWLSVSTRWFHDYILKNIHLQPSYPTPIDELHDWLWQFVNVKKESAISQPEMFDLHMRYLDNHPDELQKVLQPVYEYIDSLFNYSDQSHAKSGAILSCFAIFTMPVFKDAWFHSDYQQRFENIWDLIKKSL